MQKKKRKCHPNYSGGTIIKHIKTSEGLLPVFVPKITNKK